PVYTRNASFRIGNERSCGIARPKVQRTNSPMGLARLGPVTSLRVTARLTFGSPYHSRPNGSNRKSDMPQLATGMQAEQRGLLTRMAMESVSLRRGSNTDCVC